MEMNEAVKRYKLESVPALYNGASLTPAFPWLPGQPILSSLSLSFPFYGKPLERNPTSFIRAPTVG